MRTSEQVQGMLCPVDRTPLAMSDRQGVEIDYCPTCRGVWLDRGELDKIIERSSAELPPAPQPTPARDYSHGGGYREQHPGYSHKKRRKSFLEDFFD